MIVPDTNAMISERIPVFDGSHTIISGPDSTIGIHEAIRSVVGTIISARKIDFSKKDTINSTLLRSFLAAEIIMSAAEKTAGVTPVLTRADGVFRANSKRPAHGRLPWRNSREKFTYLF